MAIDNGRRVRLTIAGLFDGEAGEARGMLSFIPNRKGRRPRFAREGLLDGAPVRLSFIGEDGPFACFAYEPASNAGGQP